MEGIYGDFMGRMAANKKVISPKPGISTSHSPKKKKSTSAKKKR
jgi:hypothetical protein